MLATGPRPRRSVLTYVGIVAFIWICLALGPPVFTPASKATVSRYARSLETDIASRLRGSLTPAEQNMTLFQNPRIRQATMLFEGDKDHLREMYEKSIQTHVNHGYKWGVPTHILRESLIAEGSYFNKPAFLLSLMLNEMQKPKAKRAEWIVWVDGDSIIMNPEIPWDIFLPPNDFNDKHILATQDNNGFNAGMLILRVHPWTVDTLTQVVAVPGLKPELQLHFFDQSAMAMVCDRVGYREHFLYQPRRWWNRYHHDPDGEEKGEMVIHFAGVSTVMQGSTTKMQYMKKYLNRLQKSPTEWAIPIEKTTYEKEINEYWNTLRKSRKLLDKSKAWKEKPKNQPAQVDAVKTAERNLIEVVLRQTDKLDMVVDVNRKLESLLIP